jgi:hypothetical protein
MRIFLLSITILLPIITGLIRLRRIDKVYQPFFLLLVIGLITEIVSFILIKEFHRSNAIPTNLYTAVEWSMIFLHFHVWGLLRNRKPVFYGLLILVLLGWGIENLYFGQITEFSPYFRIFYAFIIVLLSVNKINYMITHDNRNLFRNPKFLICIGFIIFFIYMIVYRWAYQVSVSTRSETQITDIIIFLMAYVNALTNGIFAIAFLMIPQRVKFKLDQAGNAKAL